MILYFADRNLNILGQASTELPKGIIVKDDLKTEDVETGVSSFECKLLFDDATRLKVEEWAEVGNYILRKSDNKDELFNIIDAEIDTDTQTVYIYAEDDGLDLLNEVVGEYEADRYYPISFYVNMFAANAGWEIGVNEVEGLTRKLSFSSEQTASARLLSIAEQFNNCEISFSFEIIGLQIARKYINIYEKRGQDNGVQLRINKEVDRIVISKSIANIATALAATGGTPDDADESVTLKGYEYDDGDFYVDGSVLKSRKALERWRRYLWKGDTQQLGGHITKQFAGNATTQGTLLAETIAELKKFRDMEVNYEIDINELQDNVRIGDRVNVVDDAGELYLSTRILVLKTSEVDKTYSATLGEHLIKNSGISQKVSDLAAQFAKQTISVQRAREIAKAAQAAAEAAQAQADTAAVEAENAKDVAGEAKAAANTATQSAAEATEKAGLAQAAVDIVEKSVASLQTTVENAQAAANNAYTAAETAQDKADEAKAAAEQAEQDAADAKAAAGTAQGMADRAVTNAAAAVDAAGQAKTAADAARIEAASAKADAEQAEKDVAAFAETLETVKTTMEADYTRKTEFTETEAHLQSQITQNAAEITSTHSRLQKVDETANDAQKHLQGALAFAEMAQDQADIATADAEAAQVAADNANAAAEAAQSQADTARTAAETAQIVADNAEAALEAAKADLETVLSRADATEEEIAAAQAAVNDAQELAIIAKADADAAAEIAAAAQKTANAAVVAADLAQAVAEKAASNAALAQSVANEAKGNANEAKAIADAAAETAQAAQATADAAKDNATTAQETADAAAKAAEEAQTAVDTANAVASKAATDLGLAQQNLADVRANVDATAEEVAEAEAAVTTAQAAAEQAQIEAQAAQDIADAARADATTAQAAADTAKAAADTAQAAAYEAQEAANKAKIEVEGLAVRLTSAETEIVKNADEIQLRATKQEVTQTLGGYYTKRETESIIQQLSDVISMLVTDGNGVSLMQQTENGWTFSIGTLQKSVDSISGDLNDLTNELGDAKATVSVLDQAIGDLGKVAEYVDIVIYEDEPCIELGERDSDFKLLITNTRIMFMEGDNTPTYISNRGLNTDNITVENEMRITTPEKVGAFVWKIRSNGNMGLTWTEVAE